MPVELMLRAEGDNQNHTVRLESKMKILTLSRLAADRSVVDPNNKILRMSDELRVSVIARAASTDEEGNYAEGNSSSRGL